MIASVRSFLLKAAPLLILFGALPLFLWVIAALSGWPSPTCFQCRWHGGSPAVLVVSSACGRSDVRRAWSEHLSLQAASRPLAYIFVVLQTGDRACPEEVEQDIADGLPLVALPVLVTGFGTDGLSGLLSSDAVAMWAAAWKHVASAEPSSLLATAAAAGWWVRTRDDVAVDALALAGLLGELDTSLDVSPETTPVLLGNFVSSRCQHLFVPEGKLWQPLSDEAGMLSQGGPSHPTLISALYVLSSATLRSISEGGETLRLLLARVADESSALPAVISADSQRRRASAAGVSEGPSPLVLHAHLAATASQDLVWWSARWERPVGLATDSALRGFEPRVVNPSRRVVSASCGLALAHSADAGGIENAAKEAAAGLHDVSATIRERNSLCCVWLLIMLPTLFCVCRAYWLSYWEVLRSQAEWTTTGLGRISR